MKYLSSRKVKGKVQVTFELEDLETLGPKDKVMIVRPMHYRLGGQTDLIVDSHVLNEAVPTIWCSVSQRWVE